MIRKGDINITHTSVSVKWLHICLKTREHNKISQLPAKLPQNDNAIPSLIIYFELTQVTERGNSSITLPLRPASSSRICF